MPFGSYLTRLSRLLLILIAVGVILAAVPTTQAQTLFVRVGDTTGAGGELNSVITVYLENYQDTVGAFTLWLRFARSDIAKFQTDLDTVVDTTYWHCMTGSFPNCQDSVSWEETLHGPTWDFIHVDTVEALVGDIDTAGTLISGWEYVESRNINADGNDIRVTALANVQGDGQFTPGIPPFTGGGPARVLFRLRSDILQCDPDSQFVFSPIEIIDLAKQWFVFSRPNGTAVGYLLDTIPDSNLFRCVAWDGNECIDYLKVSLPPYDSVEYFDAVISVLDTANVFVQDGSLLVLCRECGNVNGDAEGLVDLSDLIYLVNFLFLGGPPPPNMGNASVNCDANNDVDLSDLIYLVNFLFLGGPEPCDGC
ncbi:MAG: hypothetical protein RBT76_09800 [candidate division Zixibacteria bacterium]|jgi:hypothetical protein|nr:hypothetical protein [candidate division Zixibacteria bacterium]